MSPSCLSSSFSCFSCSAFVAHTPSRREPGVRMADCASHRAPQAQHINMSLSALADVIAARASKQARSPNWRKFYKRWMYAVFYVLDSCM